MPLGPKGEKRPADVIGNAVKVMRIATGEEVETVADKDKDAGAVALGKKGGAARAARLSPEKKTAIAKRAADKRWDKEDA